MWGEGFGSRRVPEDSHKPGTSPEVQRNTGDALGYWENSDHKGGLGRVMGVAGGQPGAPWAGLTLQTPGPTEALPRAGDLCALGCL